MLLNDLILKIEQRKLEIAEREAEKAQEEEDERKMLEHENEFDLNHPRTLTNFKELGLYNLDEEGKSP
jgi:hypothetical protein